MTEASEIAGLRADVQHIKATLDGLVGRVEPLLLARSGDVATIGGIQRDLNHSHEKHRAHDRRFVEVEKRIAAVERRLDRATWLVVGAMAVLQVAWGIFGPMLLRVLGLEG